MPKQRSRAKQRRAKDGKGGVQQALSCVAVRGDNVRKFSTDDGWSYGLVAQWAGIWKSFDYNVSCSDYFSLN